MAYRKLEFGDHVRVCHSSSPHHGCNAIVIGEDVGLNKVQVNQGRIGGGPTVTFWIDSNHLLIRHDPFAFIADGKLDADAKEKYEARNLSDRYEYDPDEDDDEIEPCGTCPCCEAHNR